MLVFGRNIPAVTTMLHGSYAKKLPGAYCYDRFGYEAVPDVTDAQVKMAWLQAHKAELFAKILRLESRQKGASVLKYLPWDGIYSGRGAIGAKFLRMSARLLSWRRSAGLSFPAGDCLFFGHSRRQQTGILAFEFLLGRYSKGISQLGSEIAAAASQGDFRRVAALEGGSRD